MLSPVNVNDGDPVLPKLAMTLVPAVTVPDALTFPDNAAILPVVAVTPVPAVIDPETDGYALAQGNELFQPASRDK